MKRNLTLIITGSLTALIVISAFIIMATSLTSPTQASQSTPEPSPLLAVNIEATAQALQYQNRQNELEAAFREREATWQAQIAQKQQELTNLDQSAQAQINQLQADLSNFKSQIDQTSANIQAMQAHLTEVQQAIQTDETTYQSQVNKLQTELTNTQNQLQQQLEATNAQLQTAYNELAARQAAASSASSGDGGNSSSGGSHGDDRHSEDSHSEHEDGGHDGGGHDD